MESTKLYTIRIYIETFLWILTAVSGLIYESNSNVVYARIFAYLLIIIGIFWISTLLYFKKSPIFRATLDDSKFAIYGTFLAAAFLVYLGYIFLAKIR